MTIFENKLDYNAEIEWIEKKFFKLLCYAYENYKLNFNIDLEKDFDKNKNYYYKDLKDVKLLLLKFEDIKNWETIFKDNLNININLNNNVNKKDKNMYNLYKNIKFSNSELDRIYNNKVFKIFYSKDEINNLKNKFLEK
tara:strand:+ start:3111 stop:3527 length:417 start_codon:yes stop_codon:yes gene_type:complete